MVTSSSSRTSRGGTVDHCRVVYPWSGYGRESPTALKITEVTVCRDVPERGSDASARARLTTVSENTSTSQVDEIRAGYAFEGAVPRVGAAVVDGTAHADAHGAHPAVGDEPARPGRRRDRHRQDQDPAADGRAAVRRRACRSSSPTSRATCPAWRPPGEPSDKITARAGRRRPGLGADGLPGRVLRARRAGHRHPGAGHASRRSARSCCRRCSGSTRPRSRASGWSSTTPTRKGLSLLEPQGPARRRAVTSPATRARPSSRSSAGCRRRPRASSCAS